MIVSYVMLSIVAVLGSLAAWDDLKPMDRKPAKGEK